MELVKTYRDSLGKSMCEKIISIFENSDEKKEGITSSGMARNIKRTMDIHSSEIQNNHEWITIEQILHKELNNKLEQYYYEINKGDNKNPFFLPYPLTIDSGFNIQKYDKGDGFYKFHNDSSIGEQGSYRTLTYLWYLNDVSEGGETEFKDLKITPEQGKLLIFPALWTYPHRGNMPLSSDKYIMTGWIYSKV
jgi:hypothetical protein